MAPQDRQGGFVLILALIVLVVLFVLVPQLRFSSQVEKDLARNEIAELQMEALAHAAILKARTALLVDLDDDKSNSEGADAAAGAGGALGGAGGSALGGAGAPGAPEDGSGEEGNGKRLDSLDELWANGELTFELGEESGYLTETRITDEDAKLNVLLLAVEDEEDRRQWHERFVRLLDLMRDGQKSDLGPSEAADVVDNIERWLKGDRKNDELTVAPLASGDWKELRDQPTYAPFSLAEFSLGGGISPLLMHGFAIGEGEDRRWLPGLDHVLTVWSNLEVPEVVESPDGTTAPPADPPPGQENKDRMEAPGMNNGRVNVNTAPVAVLKCLFPDNEVPYSAWDDYDKFRTEKLQELEDERKRLEESMGEDLTPEEEPGPDDADYPLKSIDDLRRFEGFKPDAGNLTPEEWNQLASLLTVTSNVFTVTIIIGAREQPHRYLAARSIVWRRASNGNDCLPIISFQRVALGELDLAEFAQEIEEWSDSY